jgi:hypothetical protein
LKPKKGIKDKKLFSTNAPQTRQSYGGEYMERKSIVKDRRLTDLHEARMKNKRNRSS